MYLLLPIMSGLNTSVGNNSANFLLIEHLQLKYTLSVDFSIGLWWWWFSYSVMSNSCGLMGCSLPGFSVHGISQARVLEWVTISFFRGSSQPKDGTCVSYVGSGFFTTDPPGEVSP